MDTKLTKLNRVIRNVNENVFRNGDATICQTSVDVYLPYHTVNYPNEEKIAQILKGVDNEHRYYEGKSDKIGKALFKVFSLKQTACVVKHENDVDDQHLADILAKQKAMQKIENRVLKALDFLYLDLTKRVVEIDNLLGAYYNRHYKNLDLHQERLKMVKSK